MGVSQITPRELAAKDSFELIDVRPPVEFRRRHAAPARSVPAHTLDDFIRDRQGSTDEPLYVICEKGVASSRACEKLDAAGFTNIINVVGGTRAWEEARLPVIRHAKAFSLERQVRTVASVMILTGSALAYWVNINWLALPAFVGVGLLMSGLFDFCGMGMLLAKMPWNK
ncbi:MAG: DUF2892 domain-containing protein [Phycisphaera sp.]|nr:DUF2892 domain-containing protein [Phycisphaera sp.]